MRTRTGTGTGTGRDGMDDYCVAHALRAKGFDASEDGTGRGTPLVINLQGGKGGAGVSTGICPTLGADNQIHAVAFKMAVRRLTPRECERLQGFPDDYTRIPWRNQDADHCPDGPRYKALGNSMAVPVMRWLGERIAMVDGLMEEIAT